MGILGITNRTENWKTVRTLCPPLSCDAKVKLVQRLLEPYPNASEFTETSPIKFELFWRGVRDWEKRCRHPAAEYERAYRSLFDNLRCEIKGFKKFKVLRCWNYQLCDDIQDGQATPSTEVLRRNLIFTEIDIVLETPSHLFIGEAKDESRLGANSKYILAHQLIRQYVMAKILVEMMQKSHIVVPFIVGNKIGNLKNTNQVGFMIKQGWLKESNVLSWDCIKSVMEAS